MRHHELVFAHYINTMHLGSSPIIQMATVETRMKAPNADKEDVEYHQRGFEWLKNLIGFYPLFMFVGKRNEIIEYLSTKPNGKEQQTVLTYPIKALSQYGRFLILEMWCLVFDDLNNDGTVPPQRFKQVLMPSYNLTRWLNRAQKEPFNVEFVLPEIDVRAASEIITIPASG